jgi:hypothetical protein
VLLSINVGNLKKYGVGVQIYQMGVKLKRRSLTDRTVISKDYASLKAS